VYRDVSASVAGGGLNISFRAIRDNPLLNGVEVFG
jgi:hypothetical protein